VTDISGTVSPLKIYLNPLDVSISSRVILSIGRYFPFLFYFSYISWTRYTGPDFSHYVIYVSSNPQFSGSSSIILNKETSSYAFLTGITPFHDNYVILELYLNNSQQYTTESVKISYSNPFFTAANVAITGGLVFYLWLMIDYLYFRRKRNRIV
jgi:subtilase family serine protease